MKLNTNLLCLYIIISIKNIKTENMKKLKKIFFLNENKKEINLKNNKNYRYLSENKKKCIKNIKENEYWDFIENKNVRNCENNDKNINEKCNDEEYKYIIEDKKICVKVGNDEDNQYLLEDINICVFLKLNIFNKISFYIKLEYIKKICEKECNDEYKYLIEDKICVKECNDEYKYLIEDKICVKECNDEYKYFLNINNSCVKSCPLNYYKYQYKECHISDYILRDIDDNILLIHENEFEEFVGNNSCDNNLYQYKYFIVQIYNSNYIPKEDNNNSLQLNINECEKILKEKHNISINESLTIFKIEYYYENL